MNEEAKAMDAGHHAMRRVASGESPWPGMLAQDGDGELRLLVDAAVYGDAAGWDADPAGHILSPLDVVRRADGHDVVLPACTERVDAFLARRRDRRVPLTRGERVTIAVSLVRGLCEAHRTAPDAPGSWWLTSDGRPVLALDGGTDRDAAPVVTARLLAMLAAGAEAGLEAILARAAARAEQPRVLVREADELEADLFGCAVPEPLATAGAGADDRALPPARSVDVVEPAEPHGHAVGWLGRLAPHVDADLADAASQVLTSVWRRARGGDGSRQEGSRHRGRRGPLLIAGAVAVAVVCVGLAWPGGDAGSAGARLDAPAPRKTASPVRATAPAGSALLPKAGETTPGPSPSRTHAAESAAEQPEAIVRAVDELLTAHTRCGNDESCLDAVQEDPRRRFVEGAAFLPVAQRRIVPLDSFGGAAVVRVESRNAPAAEAAGAQLVVVIRDGDRWLLRDVYAAREP
jgi:hypothetical protein